MNDWKEAAEASDAAVQNMRAGNRDLAQTWAVLSIMHRLSAVATSAGSTEEARPYLWDLNETAAHLNASLWNVQPAPVLPTEPGVYQDRAGVPWYRTRVESSHPWMDLTHGHCEDRWFTDEYAAQYLPFTRMEAVQR